MTYYRDVSKTRGQLVRFCLEFQKTHGRAPNAYSEAAPHLGWSDGQMYSTLCAQKNRPYRFTQQDADDGLIRQELVDKPSLMVQPRWQNNYKVRVSDNPQEMVDHAHAEMRLAVRRTGYVTTGIAEPLVESVGALDADFVDVAEELHEGLKGVQRAQARMVKMSEKARKAAADLKEAKRLMEELQAEKKRLGL